MTKLDWPNGGTECPCVMLAPPPPASPLLSRASCSRLLLLLLLLAPLSSSQEPCGTYGYVRVSRHSTAQLLHVRLPSMRSAAAFLKGQSEVAPAVPRKPCA
jgi:hypothetical protein